MRKSAALWVAITLMAARIVGAREDVSVPEPLGSAFMLLGWSGDAVPHVEIVTTRPRYVAATAEAWVRFDSADQPVPTIYLRADTEVYRDAKAHDYQALVRLAGILAHERWHLTHGHDEVGAYTVQLSTMEHLHANDTRLAEVRRALQQLKRDGTGTAQHRPRSQRPGADPTR